MEILKKTIERYQESKRKALEQERKERIARHPHNPGCTGSRDIEYFDKRYDFVESESSFMPSIPVLTEYRSRCQECGAELEVKTNQSGNR